MTKRGSGGSDLQREGLRAFRERLEQLAQRHGRKALFVPAGVSEANFSRILGKGKKPIDNPGIFTVKALAVAAGETVGSLLGETGYDITASDRETMGTFVRWMSQRFGVEVGKDVSPVTPVSDAPGDIVAPSLHIVPQHVAAPDDGGYVFPVPKEKFIEGDYDYPQPLHAWIVPDAVAFAAGRHGIIADAEFPLATARIIHSIRDVRNALLQVIRIVGDSMSNVLQDGYKVLVDTTMTQPQNGDIVAVYIRDEGGMIGYWNKQGDVYSLTKENPSYDRVPLGDPQEWLLWGTVTTIVEAPLNGRSN